MQSISDDAEKLGLTPLPDEEIKPGDLYLAKRNTGPHLLTAKIIKNGYIVSEEMAYSYDVWECVKVKV